MRLSSVLSEAWRNVVSGAARAFVLALTLAGLGAATAFLEGATVNGIEREVNEFRSSGAAVMILSAPGAIDGVACDRLAGVRGVTRAGALRPSLSALVHPAMPASEVPVKEATPGFVALLDVVRSAPPAAGVLVSEAVADALDVDAGDGFDSRSGPLRVSAVYRYPDDGRSPDLEFAAIGVGAVDGLFDECWAEVWPAEEATRQLIRSAISVSAPPGLEIKLRQFNTRFGSSIDAQRRLDERLSRWAAIAGLSAAFALGFVSIWLRRLELASAIHAGMPRIAQLVQVTVEAVLWSAAGVLLALPVAVYEATSGRSPTAVFLLAAKCLAGVWAGAVLGAVAGALGVKERDLFRYFKQR